MLLWRQLLHQQERIEDDEAAEQEGSGTGEQELSSVALEEESEETGHDQDQETREQAGSQFAEVSLGLEGEGGESSEDDAGENQRLENCGVVIESHGGRHGNSLQQCKGQQQVQVDGMLVSVDEQSQE